MISLNSKNYCYFVVGSCWSEFVHVINTIKFIFHIFNRYFVVLNLVFLCVVFLICKSFFNHGYDMSSVVKFRICHVFCNIKLLRFCDIKRLSLCTFCDITFLVTLESLVFATLKRSLFAAFKYQLSGIKILSFCNIKKFSFSDIKKVSSSCIKMFSLAEWS